MLQSAGLFSNTVDHTRRQNVVITYVHRLSPRVPHLDVICDVLLYRRTATWNPLFVDTRPKIILQLCSGCCVVSAISAPRGLYFHLSMLFHAMFQTSGGWCSFENNERLRSRKTAERTRVHQQWSPQDRARDFQDKRCSSSDEATGERDNEPI